nr:MAG TPA: hypothetical protein [Caudoviricetes sp.]
MRGERVSRRRHKHLCEYTCCEQCSKSVAAVEENCKSIITELKRYVTLKSSRS